MLWLKVILVASDHGTVSRSCDQRSPVLHVVVRHSGETAGTATDGPLTYLRM